MGLPSEDEAVKMLLSVASLSPENVVQEALEVVKFCDRLPLGEHSHADRLTFTHLQAQCSLIDVDCVS